MSQHLKDFYSAFERAGRVHGHARVWSDLLHFMVLAWRYLPAEPWEVEYWGNVDDESKALFYAMNSAIIQAYHEEIQEHKWADVLGMIHEEIQGKGDKKNTNQFFTPESLCDLMGHLVNDKGADERPRQVINDPTCGSGRTLIARHASNPHARHFYVAQDLDLRAVRMCTINFLIHGVRGQVMHMNTLSLEWLGTTYDVNTYQDQGLPGIQRVPKSQSWSIPGGGRPQMFGPWLEAMEQKSAATTQPQIQTSPTEAPANPGQQLSLF